MSSWPALALHFPAGPGGEISAQDLALAALDGFGILAIDEVGDSHWLVFFRDDRSRLAARAALSAAHLAGVETTAQDVDDEDWARRSQAALRAIRVGRFVIAPPWDVPTDTADDDLVIVVEPSMGFGTGHHASTRLCLAALQQTGAAACRVVDVGTGSGVLAMAAARLGAASVIAVDSDADAIDSARDNLRKNGLEDDVVLREIDLRAEPLPEADLVLANLTGGLLVQTATHLCAACVRGGHLVLSGVMLVEEAVVLAAFGNAVEVVWRQTEDEWVGLGLRRS